jgi:hypothetical protein
MMSCTTLAAWSRPVSSPCYTEYGQRCGVILSDHITTVAMSRSGQLGLHCTVSRKTVIKAFEWFCKQNFNESENMR